MGRFDTSDMYWTLAFYSHTLLLLTSGKINVTIITILDPDIENINGKYFTVRVKIYHRPTFVLDLSKNIRYFPSNSIR